jgi:hypothetical protein
LHHWAREYKRGKYYCTVELLFDWFGLVCFANDKIIDSCHTGDSIPVKQEVNCTVILPPIVFPDWAGMQQARKGVHAHMHLDILSLLSSLVKRL